MIQHDLDLFVDIYIIVTAKTNSLPFINVSKRNWYLERGNWKSSFITSSALLLFTISILAILWCITRYSSGSLEEIKLIAIVIWIFQVSNFLRSFMISFNYGPNYLRSYFRYYLYYLRYSSVDSVLFLSPLLSYSIKFGFKNYLLLLVYNNLLFPFPFLFFLSLSSFNNLLLIILFLIPTFVFSI